MEYVGEKIEKPKQILSPKDLKISGQAPQTVLPPKTDEIPAPMTEVVPEPVAEVAPEPVPEPVAEVVPEPVAEVVPEPVAEVAPEPVAEVAPEPVAEVVAEPVTEVVPEPVAEVVAEPVAEVASEPVAEVVPEPVAEVAPAPEETQEAPNQQKLYEQRKSRLLAQKEEMKRKIIELNLALAKENTTCEQREPLYIELIKVQESLLFINGYYARLISGET